MTFHEPSHGASDPRARAAFDLIQKLLASIETRVATLESATNPLSVHVAEVLASEGTTSASFGNLGTTGPTISSLTTGTSVLVIVSFSGTTSVNSRGQMGVAVSGATTTAASAANAAVLSDEDTDNSVAMAFPLTVTAGSNTFTAKYAAPDGGTSGFFNRRLVVVTLN